mgnify:CR=1 FL=1
MSEENERDWGDFGAIHPDFKVIFKREGVIPRFAYNRVRWADYQNRQAEVKLIFAFDDVRLLDKCPFLAKVGWDEKQGYRFFGVVYGYGEESKELCEWGEKFPWVQLMDYRGEKVLVKIK